MVACRVWGILGGPRAFPAHFKLCHAGDLAGPALVLGARQESQGLPLLSSEKPEAARLLHYENPSDEHFGTLLSGDWAVPQSRVWTVLTLASPLLSGLESGLHHLVAVLT